MKIKKILRISAVVILSLLTILFMVVAIYLSSVIKTVKDIDLSIDKNFGDTCVFIRLDGEKENYTSKNNYIKLKDLSKDTINAFISIEDKNFFKHNGINFKRMIKAGFVNIAKGDFVQGGSTITQQLIKNKFLNNEKSIDRKIKEIYLALKFENKYNKNEILEEYLNSIYFGHGAYGIENASKRYFNKSAKDLTLNESSVLASVINSPSRYSPLNNLNNLVKRKNLVLQQMYQDGYIDKLKYLQTINEMININPTNINNIGGISLYNEFALDEACNILKENKNEIINKGYTIYTYQDKLIQETLDNVINDDKNYHVNSFGNIADSLSIITDNFSHGVSAISGRSKYDLINIKRQPGSLIKPIMVFAPAYEEGIASPISQIYDDEINYNGYKPKNVGGSLNKYISVKDVVSKSLNIPTIKLAEKVGLKKCKEYAIKSGLSFEDEDIGYSMVLGGLTKGVTLKEISDSYSAFYNHGNYVKSNFICKIVDKHDNTLYRHIPTETKVYNTDTTYLMTETLKYSVKNGTSKKLSKFDFEIAGKTGTVAYNKTNQNTDAYSLAYTSSHNMCVWLGNYSMDKKFNLEGSNNGGTYATQIISDTFEKLYKNKKPKNFVKPDSVVECSIDTKVLLEDHVIKLANLTPERYQLKELFSKRYEPKELSQKFISITSFDFFIVKNNNYVSISFDTKDYLEYYIYKNKDNNTKCINIISNNNGTIEYKDFDIISNQKYSYYIVAKNKFNDDINYKSRIKNIYIKNEYTNLNSTDTWIFN